MFVSVGQECIPPKYCLLCKHADTAYWLHAHGYKLSVRFEIEVQRGNHVFLVHLDYYVHETEKSLLLQLMEMAKWLMKTNPVMNWEEQSDRKELNSI